MKDVTLNSQAIFCILRNLRIKNLYEHPDIRWAYIMYLFTGCNLNVVDLWRKFGRYTKSD